MKKVSITVICHLLLLSTLIAQAPMGYYDSAINKTCADLKTALKKIISSNVNPQSYSSLWQQYAQTDLKSRTVGTGSTDVIYDIYSTVPNGTDPYQYTPIANQCGNYSSEGVCYNREHAIPVSWFNGNTSANGEATDYNFIFPTDGFVNGKHANYPYSKVGAANYTSLNGSKLGNSATAGITGTVFEPIDEFKGDVARAFFYFVTMYENNIPQWASNADAIQAFDANTFPSIKIPYLKQMLQWHNQDPVSQKEIDRNNGTYSFQHNRNPFIDSPQYVNLIWNSGCAGLAVLPVNLLLFTGKATENGLLFQWKVSEEINMQGYELQQSSKGTDYYSVGEYEAKGLATYTYQMPHPNNGLGTYYYRLKQIDKNGKFSYSSIIPIAINSDGKWLVYPNPAKQFIQLRLPQNVVLPIQIRVINVLGAVVLQKTISDKSEVKIATDNIPNGVYYVSIVQQDATKVERVIINK